MPSFPEYFPPDFEKKLSKDGATHCLRTPVYRIMRYGVVDRDAFLCTYKENERLKKINRKPSNSSYSTSCSNNIDTLNDLLNTTFRTAGDDPKPKIAKGTIFPDSGLSSDPDSRGHINWWIYQEAEPEKHFTILEGGDLNGK